jgi:hypothetical protein
MGLKGYRLWVMGQLDSTCRAPPGHVQVALEELVDLAPLLLLDRHPRFLRRRVAAQVEFDPKAEA